MSKKSFPLLPISVIKNVFLSFIISCIKTGFVHAVKARGSQGEILEPFAIGYPVKETLHPLFNYFGVYKRNIQEDGESKDKGLCDWVQV